MVSEHREECGGGERCSERWGHRSVDFLYPPSSKTLRQPGGSAVLNAAPENKALPRLCLPGSPGGNYSSTETAERLGTWGIKLALLFKVNHKLSNTYMSGARHGFRRFRGFCSGKKYRAQAPLQLGETEKEAVVGSEDLGELPGGGKVFKT